MFESKLTRARYAVGLMDDVKDARDKQLSRKVYMKITRQATNQVARNLRAALDCAGATSPPLDPAAATKLANRAGRALQVYMKEVFSSQRSPRSGRRFSRSLEYISGLVQAPNSPYRF